MNNIVNWIVNLFTKNREAKETEPHYYSPEELKEKKENESHEAERQAAVKLAYEACEQSYLVVNGYAYGNEISGHLKIDGLQLYAEEDMLYNHNNCPHPREDFLSFMHAHDWELVSFSFSSKPENDFAYSYTMIFKKR